MRSTLTTPLLAITALGLLASAPAAAQSVFVTHVSASGTDTGTCSTPAVACRSFGYAFSQTLAEGRILCVGSGGHGNVTITRSVTIDCSSTNSYASSGSEAAIIVDDSATASPGTINVIIRGLAIQGFNLGRRGIHFISGFSLTVENVAINGFTGGSDSAGLAFRPSRAARLLATNLSVHNSGGVDAILTGGLVVAPTGTGYASAVLENITLGGNSIGLNVNTLSNPNPTSSTNVVFNRGIVAGSQFEGVVALSVAGGRAVGLTITNSSINGNVREGILARGAPSQVRVENSTIAGNSIGVRTELGAILASYGNNSLIGNGVNGAFNGFPTEN